jgi:hypothetical protein
MKPIQIILIGLAAVLLLTVLLVPSRALPSALAQTKTTQTPQPEQKSKELPLQSGDTEGLIIGAGVIVLIIVIGVLISRVVFPPQTTDSHTPSNPD